MPSARTSRCRTSPSARRPGAQVDDERLVALDVDDEARGVPPVAPVAIPRARARPPHAVERDVHPRDVTPPAGAVRSATMDQRTIRRTGWSSPTSTDGPRGRAARPVPARVPRHGPHLALPAPRAGRGGLPGRGAVPARLRPDRRSPPTGATRSGRWCGTPTRCTRRSAAAPTRSSSATTGGRWPPTAPWRTSPTAGAGPSPRPCPRRRPSACRCSPTPSCSGAGTCSSSSRPWPRSALPLDDYSFIDHLWRDWSPGYDGAWDVARVKESIGDPEHIVAAIGYYRALYDPSLQVPELADEQAAVAAADAEADALPPRPRRRLHAAVVDRRRRSTSWPRAPRWRSSTAPATSSTWSGPTS